VLSAHTYAHRAAQLDRALTGSRQSMEAAR